MLRSHAENLWSLDYDHTLPGAVHLGARMTVLRLSDGALWLHSPVPIDDAVAGELEALGAIEHIVAPNRFHSAFAGAATRRWPNAKFWVAPGLEKKLADLEIDAEIPAEGRPWGDDLELHRIGGSPGVSETVFFHAQSGTLIVTDYIFGQVENPNFSTKSMLWMAGALGKTTQTRSWRFVFVKDRDAARASARVVLGWPVQRLIPAHGVVVEDDDMSGTMKAALQWLEP